MISAGIPIATVSKTLRHANLSTTIDLYGHLLKSAAHEAVDASPRPSTSPTPSTHPTTPPPPYAAPPNPHQRSTSLRGDRFTAHSSGHHINAPGIIERAFPNGRQPLPS